MERNIIKQVQDFGFEVYMRDPDKDRHLFFTRGDNIGYLEDSPREGLCLSTVHIPNRTSGTGFGIEQGVPELTRETLEQCFMHSPAWANSDSRAATVKWCNMDHLIQSNRFNQGYKLVPKEIIE